MHFVMRRRNRRSCLIPLFSKTAARKAGAIAEFEYSCCRE